jgi:hypothetical protein
MNKPRFTLCWHDRGPRRPLPVVIDTWMPHNPLTSEIFASEVNARASLAEREAAHLARVERWGG